MRAWTPLEEAEDDAPGRYGSKHQSSWHSPLLAWGPTFTAHVLQLTPDDFYAKVKEEITPSRVITATTTAAAGVPQETEPSEAKKVFHGPPRRKKKKVTPVGFEKPGLPGEDSDTPQTDGATYVLEDLPDELKEIFRGIGYKEGLAFKGYHALLNAASIDLHLALHHGGMDRAVYDLLNAKGIVIAHVNTRATQIADFALKHPNELVAFYNPSTAAIRTRGNVAPGLRVRNCFAMAAHGMRKVPGQKYVGVVVILDIEGALLVTVAGPDGRRGDHYGIPMPPETFKETLRMTGHNLVRALLKYNEFQIASGGHKMESIRICDLSSGHFRPPSMKWYDVAKIWKSAVFGCAREIILENRKAPFPVVKVPIQNNV